MKWLLFSLFISAPLFSTEQIVSQRDDGSEIIAYLDRPKKGEKFPVALLIAGSQKETSLRLHDSLKDDVTARGFCPITLEKRGVHSNAIDESEFIAALYFESILQDHLDFYKKLKTLLPCWNGKIVILGQGDGGRVGAHLATHIDSVDAIVLVAAGGGWSPIDETLYSFRSEMADDGFSPSYIHGFLVQAKQEFAQAIKTPKIEHQAFGYTYKYWASLLKTNLARDLSMLTCPIYSINGVQDNRVPIESVDQLAKHLEDRMILIRKEKAGRELLQDHKTYQEAISWLTENL